MYNRYVPQPDGTYKRRSVQDPTPPQHSTRPRPEEQFQAAPEPAPGKYTPPERPRHQEPRNQRPVSCPRQEKSAVSFLRDLLPRDLDTGDLLIVILLLLMSADSSGEEQVNALLTLALYLFM